MYAFPFDFNPLSVSVKTGGYTIPAGRRAYVMAQVNPSGSFTINGTTALAGTPAISSSGSGFDVQQRDSASTTEINYTVPAGYYFKGQYSIEGVGSATLRVDGDFVSSYNNNSYKPNFLGSGEPDINSSFIAGDGQVITVTQSGGSGDDEVYLVGVAMRHSSINSGQSGSPISGQYWCPAGTVFSVSSGRYTVSEFANNS